MTQNWKGATAALFVLSAAFAQAQEPAPCAAPLTPKVQPCAQPAEPPAAPPALATVDGVPVTLADLDEETRKSVDGLAAAEAKARQEALRDAIDDSLIERESARRHVTPGRLLEIEVMNVVPRPSEADVAAELAAHPEKYKRGKEDAPRATAILWDRRRRDRERELVTTLEKRFPARATDDRRMGLHVDTAIADVRIGVMEAQKSAVDRVIHDRLLRAEAVRQGIAPEELTRREVAAKLAPATEAELKAKWQTYRKFFGDDFEKDREKVRAWVDEEKKDEAEKAFDARLRAGHAIRLLFDVPPRPAQDVAGANAPFTGPRDAKVTLVEFGDFECPPCGYMSGVLDEALRSYDTRVRYVFRQFPLTFHPFARKAAEASLAAHAQGKFFPYAHILFAHQDALDVPSLKKYATDAGLDRKQFDADLDSGRFAPVVIEDQRLGTRSGVIGTPAFFLDGVLLGGDAYTLEGMRAAIDRALARH